MNEVRQIGETSNSLSGILIARDCVPVSLGGCCNLTGSIAFNDAGAFRQLIRMIQPPSEVREGYVAQGRAMQLCAFNQPQPALTG